MKANNPRLGIGLALPLAAVAALLCIAAADAAPTDAGNNPCVDTITTNCQSASFLMNDLEVTPTNSCYCSLICLGDSITASVKTNATNGRIWETHTCPVDPKPDIVCPVNASVGWVISGPPYNAVGSGITTGPFIPTNTGFGTVIFTATWSSDCGPCSTSGVQTLSCNFAVIKPAFLVAEGCTNAVYGVPLAEPITSTSTLYVTVSTTDVVRITALPTPAVDCACLSNTCWSLTGAGTNSGMFVPTSDPQVSSNCVVMTNCVISTNCWVEIGGLATNCIVYTNCVVSTNCVPSTNDCPLTQGYVRRDAPGCVEVIVDCCGHHGLHLRVVVLDVDLDIDSDHTTDFGGPERNDTEESIEDQSPGPPPHQPHKFVVVDDYYEANTNGIPGYADGFNLDGVTSHDDLLSSPYGPKNDKVFIPLVLEFNPCNAADIDWSTVAVRFQYSHSPPGDVQTNQECAGMAYTPAGGNLRIWTKDEPEARNMNWVSHSANGTFVPSGVDIVATNLGLPGTVTLYMEGIHPSASFGSERVDVTISGIESGACPLTDFIHCTVIRVDVDVDSDNNEGYTAPARPQPSAEDHYEDRPDLPGKILAVNDNDDDGDGIPDFADGYDLYGSLAVDNVCTNERFVPIVFEIPAPISLYNAKVRLTYEHSYPKALTNNAQGECILPDTGSLRIWTKDGNVARNGMATDAGGDFLRGGVYTAADFGFTAGKRVLTYYLEAVKPSSGMADQQVLFEVDPDGDAATQVGYLAADAVRLTAIEMQLFRDDENCTKVLDDWPALADGSPRSPKYVFGMDRDIYIRVKGPSGVVPNPMQIQVLSEADPIGVPVLLREVFAGTYRNSVQDGELLRLGRETSEGSPVDRIKVVDEEVLTFALNINTVVLFMKQVMVDRGEAAATTPKDSEMEDGFISGAEAFMNGATNFPVDTTGWWSAGKKYRGSETDLNTAFIKTAGDNSPSERECDIMFVGGHSNPGGMVIGKESPSNDVIHIAPSDCGFFRKRDTPTNSTYIHNPTNFYFIDIPSTNRLYPPADRVLANEWNTDIDWVILYSCYSLNDIPFAKGHYISSGAFVSTGTARAWERWRDAALAGLPRMAHGILGYRGPGAYANVIAAQMADWNSMVGAGNGIARAWIYATFRVGTKGAVLFHKGNKEERIHSMNRDPRPGSVATGYWKVDGDWEEARHAPHARIAVGGRAEVGVMPDEEVGTVYDWLATAPAVTSLLGGACQVYLDLPSTPEGVYGRLHLSPQHMSNSVFVFRSSTGTYDFIATNATEELAVNALSTNAAETIFRDFVTRNWSAGATNDLVAVAKESLSVESEGDVYRSWFCFAFEQRYRGITVFDSRIAGMVGPTGAVANATVLLYTMEDPEVGTALVDAVVAAEAAGAYMLDQHTAIPCKITDMFLYFGWKDVVEGVAEVRPVWTVVFYAGRAAVYVDAATGVVLGADVAAE